MLFSNNFYKINYKNYYKLCMTLLSYLIKNSNLNKFNAN